MIVTICNFLIKVNKIRVHVSTV